VPWTKGRNLISMFKMLRRELQDESSNPFSLSVGLKPNVEETVAPVEATPAEEVLSAESADNTAIIVLVSVLFVLLITACLACIGVFCYRRKTKRRGDSYEDETDDESDLSGNLGSVVKGRDDDDQYDKEMARGGSLPNNFH